MEHTFTELIEEAEKFLEDRTVYKKFTKGTPLRNDIPTWMAMFVCQIRKEEECK